MEIRSQHDLLELLKDLDRRLVDPLEVYIIGGANLVATGVSTRPTADIDVICPVLFPPEVLMAIRQIAVERNIVPKWINTMPSLDLRFLAEGWRDRCALFLKGRRLRVLCLGRKDMLGLKIAAAFDRRAAKDVEDIRALAPTEEEWEFGRSWAREYDANPEWPRLIDELVRELKERQRG